MQNDSHTTPEKAKLKRKEYEEKLGQLQIELSKLQEWVRYQGLRIIVLFEGRDAAGKGGAIKAITERVSPRVFRVIALPAPTERDPAFARRQRHGAAARKHDRIAAWAGARHTLPSRRRPGRLRHQNIDVQTLRSLRIVVVAVAELELGIEHLLAGEDTILPVLGIPMESASLKGLDSLLSTVQMPGGIPVATFAIGKPGAVNAALFAVAVLASKRPDLAERLARFRSEQAAKILKEKLD